MGLHWIDALWYGRSPWRVLLYPFSYLFQFFIACRRKLITRRVPYAIPVIVVGNLVVGGAGKTPVVAAIVEALKAQGRQPVIISRGYGGGGVTYPYQVMPTDAAKHVGDEPLLLARRLGVPVVIDPDRNRAALHVIEQSLGDVIVSDDGLQHYRLYRDIEIVLVDRQRRFGNACCLPAGPLREPLLRLKSVDAVIVNHGSEPVNETVLPEVPNSVPCYDMQLQPADWCRVREPSQRQSVTAFQGKAVHAVVGIGVPARFLTTLRPLCGEVIAHVFPDHHAYVSSDLDFGDDLPVVMTEKDAVKCGEFARDDVWYLPVTGQISAAFFDAVLAQDCLKRRG